jgi:hypothetical protein
MVTGRGCFPVGERGHRWLPESRPGSPLVRHSYMCTARQRHCLSPRRRQEIVRRVAVLMSTTPDEPEWQALQSGHSFSLVRVVMGNLRLADLIA